MSGWQKPVSPPRQSTWVEMVVKLYIVSPSMLADEFEELYSVALQGERPDHPDLPERLPSSRLDGMPTRGELR